MIAPQQVAGHAGRRDPAPVGGGHRLLGRAVDLRRDPQARGGGLPPHPQHAALPARQHRRLRSGEGTRCRSSRWLEIDRYALALTRAAAGRAAGATTSAYEFHRVVQQLQTFCSEDLGALLPRHPQGPALHHRRRQSLPRRSAQNALHHITAALRARCMAPILRFTAEEVWARAAPAIADDFVMLHTWHELPRSAGRGRAARQAGARMRAIRADVQKELEDLRVAGGIGSSLQAEVEVRCQRRDARAAGRRWATTCASC
ncbi:MAG: class I tRNA ligase family protein [Chromatiales bacterium]|nr:class I tRNA ligase family protein [Chromatiales bacterium]